QRELERAEKSNDVLERHEAKVGDADELSFHLALTAGHDRVVVVTQDADEIPCIDAGWRTERGHRGRRVTLVGEELKVDGLQTASMSLIGFRTPVEVSLCVMRTAFAASLPFSFASSSRTRSGSTARP